MTLATSTAVISRVVPWVLAVASGLIALRLASLEPSFSSLARSPLHVALGLGAGWSLIAVGPVSRRREAGGTEGLLLVLAGLSWFAVELSNPASGSALVFTVGLVAAAVCPPLVAHVTLAYPGGRLGGAAERAAIVVAYATGVLWSGVLATLAFDPSTALCSFCPANLLSLGADRATHDLVTSVGVVMLVAWTSAVVVLAAGRVARASTIRLRRIGPVVVPGAIFIGSAAVDGIRRAIGTIAVDEVSVELAVVQAICLIAMSAGVAWPWLRARRTRAAVAALVVELQRSGYEVRNVLSRELDDPELEVGYPLADGHAVEQDGRPIELRPDERHAVTPLVRGRDVVAVLRHRRELLDDPERMNDVVDTFRLALDGERLRAELRAQLTNLRESRGRIVEASDAERRRLERDLHDGAQQRLVGLAMALRMLDRELQGQGLNVARQSVAEATRELQEGMDELRDLAHGIYPAALSGEGLSAALEGLQEASPLAMELGRLPTSRFDARVEETAYFVVAEALRQTAATRVRVAAEREDGRLVVEIDEDATAAGDLTALHDRVGALDGAIGIKATPTSLSIRAEIPCAS